MNNHVHPVMARILSGFYRPTRPSCGAYVTSPRPCCPKCNKEMAFEAEDWEGDPSEPGLMHRLSAYWFCDECDYTEQAEMVDRDE